jgi:PII-like signaling protein
MKIPEDAVLLRIFIGESDRHSEEKVNAFLPVLDGMMGGGLVTLERAKVIRYQDQGKR